MPLQHALHSRCFCVPELDSAILRSRDDPLTVMRDRDRENVILQWLD